MVKRYRENDIDFKSKNERDKRFRACKKTKTTANEPKKRKRKEESEDDEDEEIDLGSESEDQADELEDELAELKDSKSNIDEFMRKHRKNPKLKKAFELIAEREITEDQIEKLQIPDEEKAWFLENIALRNDLLTIGYYEDAYKLKYKIYNKYKEMTEWTEREIAIEEKLKSSSSSNDSILNRIINSGWPEESKVILYKKYHLLNTLGHGEEYAKGLEWLNTVLDLPTTNQEIKVGDVATKLNNLRLAMDNKLYGLAAVKEKILEKYCAMLTGDNKTNKIIALVGPPGVAKTVFGNSVADFLDISFEKISLGGAKDSSFLTGHSSTYIGARPGVIVTLLRKMKHLDGLVFIDEIDKVTHTSEGHSVYSTLLHILDKSQNNKFQDAFMPEIPINLSKIFFIVAMNDETVLDPILRDRLDIIRISPYTVEDKVNIGMDYILPTIYKNLDIKTSDVKISKPIMNYIINKSQIKEAGVRQLERNLQTIFERINVLKNVGNDNQFSYNIPNFKLPITLTERHIDILFKEN